MFQWISAVLKDSSYSDEGHADFSKAIKFVKEEAPYLLVGALAVIAHEIKWGKTIVKCAAFGIGQLSNRNEEIEPVEEKPKQLPPPQPTQSI